MKKPGFQVFLFCIFFFATLFTASCIQKKYLDRVDLQFFPDISEYKPESPGILDHLWKEENKEEEKSRHIVDNLHSGRDNSYLKNFYEKLSDLERNKNRVVRILHMGDSLIWADMLTLRVKQNFDRDFGDGGRGIVPAFYKLERWLYDHENPTGEGNFTWHRIKPWGSPNPHVGFIGETFIPIWENSNSIQILGKKKEPWKKIQFIVRKPKDSKRSITQLQVKSGENIYRKEVSLNPGDCKLEEISLQNAEKINIQFTGSVGPLPYIDGIILETDRGVSYSAISTMGVEMNDQLQISEDNFACGAKFYKPDLVVFHFGVNETQNLWLSIRQDRNFYRKAIRDVVRRYKKYLPETNLILMSPVERIRKNSSGVYITMPEMLEYRQMQMEIAEEENIAFYDSFQALGGEGKSADLYRRGIIQEDRTHLTRSGSEYLGEIFYNDLYNQYRRFLGKQQLTKEIQRNELKKEKDKAVNFTSKSYLYFLSFIFVLTFLFSGFPQIKLFFFLCFSYYFYMSWNLWPILLLVGSTIVDYFCALGIEKKRTSGKTGKEFLITSLFLNLGLLFIFKYFTFTLEIFNQLFLLTDSKIQFPTYKILLPVGISFYTFQTISYTIDVYRNKIFAERNFWKFAFYISFFPQLVAGPIVRASTFLPSINHYFRHFSITTQKFSTGIFLIICGMIKKISADWLGVNLVDRVYNTPEMYSTIETIAATYGYALQIYGDFSGYSDIAIGSAMILGFHLTENFQRPYQSKSITEFWRRWHISLGSWFRDYLYISMGGNRKRVYINLAITMFLCGLWHGAGWNFIFWGIFHGFFLIIERIWKVHLSGLQKWIQEENEKFTVWGYFKTQWIYYLHVITVSVPEKFRNCISVFTTFHIVLIGWVFFRVKDMEHFKKIISNLKTENYSSPNLDLQVILVILGLFLWHFTPIQWREQLKLVWTKTPLPAQGFVAASISLGLYKISNLEAKAFIYFQF
jgi:D-alanyl-lipoteichoic acid acyltransferase DltB (MBOAT superfamily)/lysophospholipase L1-like esterase